MATPEAFATCQTREDSWRLRLEETEARYQKATERYRRLLQEQPDATPYDPRAALALARQAESEALSEYSRIPRAFTELTVNGKVRSAAGSDSL